MSIIDQIKTHLAKAGNVVQLTTYTRSQLYDNADDFKSNDKGEVYVRRGRRWDCIATTGSVLVGIRLGRYTEGR